MAIDTSQLIIQPVMNTVFPNPDTGLPLVGTATFYKAKDTTVLKNMYIQTNDGTDSFEVAPNPYPLVNGGFESPLYPYPYDEDNDDELIDELYYIVITREDGKTIKVLIDWPQNFDSASENSENSNLKNLCPSYGFDYRILPSYYNSNDQRYLTEIYSLIAQGWVWYKNAPTNSNFYYYFSLVDAGILIGNPAFALTVIGANFGTAQSQNWLGFAIATNNALSGKTINFQFYGTDNSIIPVSSLDIAIALDGVDEPTTVATVTLTQAQSLITASFEMPDLSDDFTQDCQKVFLVIKLPLSQNFSISFTGMLCYIGDTLTNPEIQVVNFGLNTAAQLLPEMDKSIQANDNEDVEIGKLALSMSTGTIDTRNSTGTIFVAPINKSFNYAVPLVSKTIVRDNFILAPTVLANRLLDDESGIAKLGGNAFVISDASENVFTIATNEKTSSYSEWISQTSAVSIVANESAAENGITSEIDSENPLQLNVTFDTNYDAVINPYNPEVTTDATVYVWGDETAGSDYQGPSPSQVILNYMGVIQQTLIDGTLYCYGLTYTNVITVTQTEAGDVDTPAKFTITIPENGFSKDDIQTSSFQADIGAKTTGGLPGPVVYKNCLIYSDEATITATDGIMPAIPPYAIQFHVDSEGDNVPTSIKTITANFSSSILSNGELLAIALNDALNVGANYTITVNSVPTNGDILNISTTDTNLNVIFYDTAQEKPSNPDPSRIPLFVSFSSDDSTSDIATSLATVLTNDVGGIPIPNDLSDGVTKLADLPSTLNYFLEV